MINHSHTKYGPGAVCALPGNIWPKTCSVPTALSQVSHDYYSISMSMPSFPLARRVAVVWLSGHLPSQLLLGCRPGNMRGGVFIIYSVVSDKIKQLMVGMCVDCFEELSSELYAVQVPYKHTSVL